MKSEEFATAAPTPVTSVAGYFAARKWLLLATLLAALLPTAAPAQQIAVSTDLAADLFAMPSAGVELTTGERTTVGLHAVGTHYPWGLKAKGWGLMPELRYYLSGRLMSSYFIGIGALAATYDVTRTDKRWRGEAAGLGLTFGYVVDIGRRLAIDLHAGMAPVFYRQKEGFLTSQDDPSVPYYPTLQTANAKGYTLLPTRFGVSLVYILK